MPSSSRVAGPELALPGRFRGAVFDFDGLLVDSEPGWARAEERLLARHGHRYTDADRLATVGRSIDDSVCVYAERLGLAPDGVPALRAELIELARAEYLAGFPIRPGATALVGALGGWMPVGLASNTDRMLVEAALERTPFATAFRVIVTADDVEHPKPAPDLYLLACRLLGVEPSAAIAFEDSASGVRAAKAAGLTVVAVPQEPELGAALAGLPDLVVASLAELAVREP
jgi:HAD superfamily hydrolase (TIGR01509 family)